MTIRTLSDLDLLALLVGETEAHKLYSGSLASLLFTGEGSENHVERITAAREFVRRAIEEDLQRKDVLSQPAQVADYLKVLLKGREHEAFVVLFLDAQNCLIVAEELFRGTLTQTAVYPREVVKRALAVNAAAVIFAHNHPSGVAEPSKADEMLTNTLKQALALVDVKVLDHFVVAGAEAMSFAERGLV